MTSKEIKKKLEKININKNDYYILGSASLVIRGIKNTAKDIDIAISMESYKKLNIDVINDSAFDFNIKKKIDSKIEFINNYNLQTLEEMLENKKRRKLLKDIKDINIIENEISNRKKIGEYVDLYDENKNKLNEIVFRKKGTKSIVPDNRYSIVVIAIIENKKGEILLQKASKRKNNIWGIPGGHTKAGQTSLESIVEELKEEMELKVKSNEIKLIKTYKYKDAYRDVYYIKKNIDINKLKIEYDEVEEIKYLSIDSIEEKINEKKFREHDLDVFYDIIKNKVV